MSREMRGRPKGSTNKMNNVQVKTFLREATKKILNDHLSYSTFIEWATDNYDIGANQANKYWVRIWDELKSQFKLERELLVTKHLQKYWLIHDEALKNGDLNTARQVLNDIGKLQGLNEPESINISTEGIIEFKFGGADKEDNS